MGRLKLKIDKETGLLFFYICASYLLTKIHFNLGRQYAPARLEDLAYGKAALPFQFRLLVPYIVRLLSLVIRTDLLTIYTGVEFLATIALFLSYRYFLSLFFRPAIADILPFVLVYALPFNYAILTTMFYPSDIPAILFFTLALTFMYKQQWREYYLLYFIATLNRETTCFLTFIFLAVFFKRIKFTNYILHLACQFVLWVGIKEALYLAFKSNPGWLYEKHIETNINMFLEILSLNFYPLINLILNFGGLWLIVPFAFKYAPEFLRRSLFVLVPFLIGMFIVGNLYEMRIYGELLPVLVTIALFPVVRSISGTEEQIEKI